MSKEKQSKRKMLKALNKMLDETGLGADFMSKKDKKDFIKYVQDMGETIPPKEFHTGQGDYKFAFSKGWENIEFKLTSLHGLEMKGGAE